MLIPFRVRNPIKSFPYVTVLLLAVNIVIYLLTSESEYFMRISPDVYNQWAFTLGNSSYLNFLLSSFLHTNLVSLIINMGFLAIFGPLVEERLQIPRFLLVYFLAGLLGNVLQVIIGVLITGQLQLSLGSTSNVMGIVGAYWYIFSWSTVDVFYFLGFWYGVIEVAAFWVVGFYFLTDLVEGILLSYKYGGNHASGLANIAHVAAGVIAVYICIATHVKRDTEALSEAKALQMDAGDPTNMPIHALETMLAEDPTNVELLRGLFVVALRKNERSAFEKAIERAGPPMIDKDPLLVAEFLIEFRGDYRAYKPVHLLHLGSQLERLNEPNRAMTIYRLISDHYPEDPDAETAVYRMGLCTWHCLKDPKGARHILQTMQQRYPSGKMTQFGKTLLKRINDSDAQVQ